MILNPPHLFIDSPLPFSLPLTQPFSHLSATAVSCSFPPLIPSLIHPAHSGIHTGAIDLETAVAGDPRKDVRWNLCFI